MVTINDHSWIGIGATLVNNINIGQYVTIGAGSVVLNDVRDNATVYGVPARESGNYA